VAWEAEAMTEKKRIGEAEGEREKVRVWG